ncbi:Short-chain dehydrogenase/reductase SDR [Neofusicoccum parvum]|nr:Short-chain dehydrogenase/reductase SDR [Neofusicoccum parvum]
MTSHAEFTEASTATEVAKAFSNQIKDRHIVITGVSKNGIGETTAHALAAHKPALLILASRTPAKLSAVAAELAALHPHTPVKTVVLDLASQPSIRRAASEILALTPRIDILINNAGLTTAARETAPDGTELQFAANHVGHFLLTNLVGGALAAGARVVNVASEGHRFSPLRFSDYNFVKGASVPAAEQGPPLDAFGDYPAAQEVDGYVALRGYGQSKTANVLFSVGLNRRLGGRGVVSYAVHPGAIVTELSRDVTPDGGRAVEDLFRKVGMFIKNLDQGGATTLVAALDPALNDTKNGIYLSDCQFLAAEPYAIDETNADKLWTLTEELVGQKFI